jgi:nucleotide-binding universal stress UspA family protein
MNILLPTDFSDNSRNAVAYALEFFRDTPCTFHLLHVSSATYEILSFGHHSMPDSIKEKFDDLLSWVNTLKVNTEHHFSVCFKVNYFIEAIRDKVAEKNIDLILMGTKGATNQKEIILGKNTSDVVMKVKCPTLAISENAVFQPHKEILFPTDYRIRYSAKMLQSLKNIARLSHTSIKILELFASEKEPGKDQISNREALKNSLIPEIPETQTYYSIKDSDPKHLFRTNRNVDMIVMAAKNLNLCQKLLKDHSNHQIPFIRKLPLLILHD